MEPPMQLLWNQAFKTFVGGKESPVFESNFQKLQDLMDTMTAADVKLDPSLLEWHTEGSTGEVEAPVSYISVYADDTITMGVFIVKSGAQIPLHDHPNMHGIIKVISGLIRVQSYTVIPTFRTEDLRKLSLVRENAIVVEKHPAVIVDEHSPSCALTPRVGNFHAIRSVDGPAAFLDILSPPYDKSPENEESSCHFYEEVPLDRLNTSDVVMLYPIPDPLEYWTDLAPYDGPELISVSSFLE